MTVLDHRGQNSLGAASEGVKTVEHLVESLAAEPLLAPKADVAVAVLQPVDAVFELGDPVLKAVDVALGLLASGRSVGSALLLGRELALETTTLLFEFLDAVVEFRPAEQIVEHHTEACGRET